VTATRERWVRQVRGLFPRGCARELLEHAIIFNEHHLRRLLADYVAYYHDDRTHLGFKKATPASRSVAQRREGEVEVVALPRLGGLHHRYELRAAA
jgi:hypothetical protein